MAGPRRMFVAVTLPEGRPEAVAESVAVFHGT